MAPASVTNSSMLVVFSPSMLFPQKRLYFKWHKYDKYTMLIESQLPPLAQ